MASLVFRGIDKDLLGNRVYARYSATDVQVGFYVGASLWKSGRWIDFPAKQDWFGGDSSIAVGELSLYSDLTANDALVIAIWNAPPSATAMRLADVTVNGTSLGALVPAVPSGDKPDLLGNIAGAIPLVAIALVVGAVSKFRNRR